MKELWVETDNKEALSTLVSLYADALVEGDKTTFLANKQSLKIVSPSVDSQKLDVTKKVARICLSDKLTENLTVKAAESGASYLLIQCTNWRVIPLENLIARTKGKSKIIAEVISAEEAKVALETLELGTDGVLLKTSNPEELIKTIAIVKPEALKLAMSSAKIVSTKPIGTGARVCVDTCELMKQGEGMLVGSQSVVYS